MEGYHTYYVGEASLLVHNMCDVNKLLHIFGNSKHNLGALVNHFGSEKSAFEAIQQATEMAVNSKGIKGIFEIPVSVGGTNVTVRGNAINNTVKIGTAFR